MSGLRDDIAERLAKLLPDAMVIALDGSRVDAEYGDQPRPWVSIGLEYTDASYEAHAATALADRLEAGDKAIAVMPAIWRLATGVEPAPMTDNVPALFRDEVKADIRYGLGYGAVCTRLRDILHEAGIELDFGSAPIRSGDDQ